SVCSFATSGTDLQPATLAEVWIVGELGDLEIADRDDAEVQRCAAGAYQALESQGPHCLDALDGLGGGDDPAEIDRLAEREIVGMEDAEAAIGQNRAGQFALHGAEH